VELTVALERVYVPEKDRIVFDVGHQCYTHKLITGRREMFGSLRQYGGMSGFPKPCESDCEAFIQRAMLQNAVSVTLGMAWHDRDLGGTMRRRPGRRMVRLTAGTGLTRDYAAPDRAESRCCSPDGHACPIDRFVGRDGEASVWNFG
jgi:hypothetical protein